MGRKILTGIRWILLGLGVLFLIQFVGVLWFWGGLQKPHTSLQPRSFLTVTVSDTYTDYNMEGSLLHLLHPENHSLHHLIQAIELARTDSNIIGLIVRIDENVMGVAMIEELRNALKAFRQSNKPVYVITDTFGFFKSALKEYYLATVANEIWLQPMGDLHFSGLGITLPFMKKLLDRVGVEPQIGKRHAYKTAPEMFTHEAMSPENRESLEGLLNGIQSHILLDISKDRNIPVETLQTFLKTGFFTDQESLQQKLIDKLGGMQDLKTSLSEKFGPAFHTIAYRDYLDHYEESPPADKPYIAVLYLSGEIHRGTGEGHSHQHHEAILSHRVTSQIHSICENKNVKALVVRLDTPGGEAVAAETIWQALHHFKKTYGPVVVSMGNTAASGGYWIATAANKIVAHPTTVTGSIGVYGGKFVLQKPTTMLGISWGEVATTEAALENSMVRPYSKAGWAQLNKSLDTIYDRFLEKVATARGLSKEEAHKIAQGRVWTGEQARRLKLVDELGDLNTAIEQSAQLAHLDLAQTEVIYYPRHKSMGEMFAQLLWGKKSDPEPMMGILIPALFSHVMTEIQNLLVSSQRSALLSPVDGKVVQ